jgi:hypothetical protein
VHGRRFGDRITQEPVSITGLRTLNLDYICT